MTLHQAILTLLDEVRYECTTIADFNLPCDFFPGVIQTSTKETGREKKKCTAPKRKRKADKYSAAARKKDKERKRTERNLKKQANQKEDLDAISMISQNKKPSNETYSQKRYRLNLNYKKTKQVHDKVKYESDISYQQKKKDSSKQKYYSNTEFQQEKKTKTKAKYRQDIHYQMKVKSGSKKKYRENTPFKEEVKSRSKTKYRENTLFKEEVKSRSKTKYRENTRFKEKVKSQSKTKYKHNLLFQHELKMRSKTKYKNNPKFRQELQNRSRVKYRLNLQFQQAVKKASIQRYASSREFQEKLKRINLLRYRKNILTREKYRYRLHKRYSEDLLTRQKIFLQVQKQRLKGKNNITDWFKNAVKDGPRYVCSVCHKFKFRKQVVECNEENYTKKGAKCKEMANHCITHEFIHPCIQECKMNCETVSHKHWICYTCHRQILNGKMPVDAYSNGLQLPKIPDELNSLNKLEKQLISLRIPFMKIVHLPKGNQRGIIGPCVSVPTDIQKTTNVLPRCDDESQLIRCKLKRKLEYKGHCQYEFISTKKICNALDYLQQNNPYYQDKVLNQAWIDNVPQNFQDFTIADAKFSQDSNELANCSKYGELCDQNKNYSVVNTEFPDMSLDQDANAKEEEDQSVRDRGLPLDTCLQPVDLGQEILDQHFDKIFSVAPGEGNTPVNMLQEEGNEAMSFPVQFSEGSFGSYDGKRLTRITRSRYFHTRLLSADSRFSSDSSYIFYAQYLSELEQVISKVSIALRKGSGKDISGNTITASMLSDRSQLKNLLNTDQGYKFLTPIRGTPPYWQATLRDLMATIRQLGIPTFFATFSAADMRWTEILQILLEQQQHQTPLQDLDWTAKSEILRNNPVMSAIMFDHRWNTFLKEVIIKGEIIGKVKDHFHRIEFQQRGSPHTHCLFWIQDAPLLDKDDDQTICDFVDRYITCKLPDKASDPDLHEIVSNVQQHSKNHSKSCQKNGTTCRFNFPRPPSSKTFVSRNQSDPSVSEEKKANSQNTLQKLWNVLQNDEIENMTTQNLFKKAGVTQEEFEEASNIITKRTNITLQRQPRDVWTNQYNPDLLRCWNANMDIQFITDPYSCVMYIISYISKAEREMGLVLETARKEAAEGNCDAQQTMKKIGAAYFRQREVSSQEAAYRVCGLHLKEFSRKVQFVPTGENQVKMSLPLNVIRMKADQLEDENIWMTSLYDRYKARPVTSDFDSLCYASFSSEYRVLSTSQLPKNPTKCNVHKLQDNLGYIKKRSRTDDAVIRYPRFSLEKNPELYYQSLLQLFLPHRTENQLKPNQFKTYEEMYLNGAVVLQQTEEPQSVQAIIHNNQRKFERNAEALHEAEEMINMQGPLQDAWALIAPESEVQRLEDELEKEHFNIEDYSEIPELNMPKRHAKQVANIELRQTFLTTHEIQLLLRQLNTDQKMVFIR